MAVEAPRLSHPSPASPELGALRVQLHQRLVPAPHFSHEQTACPGVRGWEAGCEGFFQLVTPLH